MLHNETRHSQRYSLSLSAHIAESASSHPTAPNVRGTIISISAGGCAMRTTARLEDGRDLLLTVLIDEFGRLRRMRIPARMVWGRNDYRIDTLYQYGLRFLEPLRWTQLQEVLEEDALSAQIMGPFHSESTNKSVA